MRTIEQTQRVEQKSENQRTAEAWHELNLQLRDAESRLHNVEREVEGLRARLSDASVKLKATLGDRIPERAFIIQDVHNGGVVVVVAHRDGVKVMRPEQ